MPRRRRRFRAPYDTPILTQETEDAYALANKYVPKLKRAWIKGLVNLGSEVEQAVLQALTSYYEVAPGVTAIEVSPKVKQALIDLRLGIATGILGLWEETREQTKQALRKDEASYNEFATKPELMAEAVSYAEVRSSALVTSITETMRGQIRDLITQGIEAGEHPKVVARRVRGLGLGLADKGSHTYGRVQRYMIGQMEASVSGKVLERRVKRFHDKLVKDRAESIARTEMISAQAEARRLTWIAETGQGLIDSRSERVWIAGFNRTCADCQIADGTTAPLTGLYPSGLSGPPAHVGCRCTEGLRLA